MGIKYKQMKWIIDKLTHEINSIYGMLGTTPPTSWEGTQEQWDIKEQQKAKDLLYARKILKKHLKNNEDMIENPYTAKQAKADYLAKKNQKDNRVDKKKIEVILLSIKDIIERIDITESNFPQPSITVKSLSKGEQKILTSIGYEVKEELKDKLSEGQLFLISW